MSDIYHKLGRLAAILLLIVAGWIVRGWFDQIMLWRHESGQLHQLIDALQKAPVQSRGLRPQQHQAYLR